jgi:predicted transcriptional regulator
MVMYVNTYKGEEEWHHMTNYRTSMQIISDLLVATNDSGVEGIKITRLLTRVNLSHSRLLKILDALTGSGLVNRIEFDGKNTIVITEKGRQYLESYMKFASIAGSFGLEL